MNCLFLGAGAASDPDASKAALPFVAPTYNPPPPQQSGRGHPTESRTLSATSASANPRSTCFLVFVFDSFLLSPSLVPTFAPVFPQARWSYPLAVGTWCRSSFISSSLLHHRRPQPFPHLAGLLQRALPGAFRFAAEGRAWGEAMPLQGEIWYRRRSGSLRRSLTRNAPVFPTAVPGGTPTLCPPERGARPFNFSRT